MTPEARKELEKAQTLPLAEARQSALGLARTQPIAAVSEVSALPQPRRVRPVAALPEKSPVAARPIEPIKPAPMTPIAQKPVAQKPVAQVSAPAVRAGILPPASVDDGWNQGRKRSREIRPLRPLKVAEGTQPGVAKPTLDVPRAAGKGAVKAVPSKPVERARLAEGSLPPPPTAPGKPLPSLFSVIDRKKPAPQSADSSRLPGLPPPPPARPSIGAGPKKAVTTVVAAASLGSAQMAIAATRQTGQHAVVPPPAAMLLDDCDVEELEEIEDDLPDFIPTGAVVAGILMNAKSAAPTPLFDAPRVVAMPPQATSFSAAERAFFAAGEEMDTLDMDPETFEDLPGVERPSFWSRLKNRAGAGG